jgi:hypothetical protein
LIYFCNGQDTGQAATDFGWIDIRHWIAGQLVPAGKKIKKGTQGGQAPGIAA